MTQNDDNSTSAAVSGPTIAPLAGKHDIKSVRATVSALQLATDGDDYEKRYWAALRDHFPNYETFWRDLVTPMTRRIDLPVGAKGRHERREHIAEDLWEISYINYSIFLNLSGAHEHLTQPVPLSLGNFYTHLASACELAEEFLLRVHRLVSECRGTPIPELAPLPKQVFLDECATWYDTHYKKAYEHYHQKGKKMMVPVDPTESIISAYTKNNNGWKEFIRFRQPIREFRNRVVHNVQLGTIRDGGKNLMPRPDKILSYASITAVQNAFHDRERLAKDFVVREEQMQRDFIACNQRLNDLWNLPIDDLRTLLYERHNATLLDSYHLVSR
jgi:hypothetical protein